MKLYKIGEDRYINPLLVTSITIDTWIDYLYKGEKVGETYKICFYFTKDCTRRASFPTIEEAQKALKDYLKFVEEL